MARRHMTKKKKPTLSDLRFVSSFLKHGPATFPADVRKIMRMSSFLLTGCCEWDSVRCHEMLGKKNIKMKTSA